MATNKPHVLVRGDLVRYANQTYYFQPNGNSCYLYDYKENIGTPQLAAHAVRRSAILPSVEEEEEEEGVKVPVEETGVAAEAGNSNVEEAEEEAAPAVVLADEISKLGPKQLQLVEDLVAMLRNMNLAAGADRVYQ